MKNTKIDTLLDQLDTSSFRLRFKEAGKRFQKEIENENQKMMDAFKWMCKNEFNKKRKK